LSPAEIAQAGLAGCNGVRLGPRILRTETAGLAALAAMQALWGDWH
jgi:16S rRNA (uracil1498-N3)-methyltransferase